MSENILSRRKSLSLLSQNSASFMANGESLSSTQSLVDGLVTHFVDEAADPKTLAALTAGGLAYRYGRIGAMALGNGRIATLPLRFFSVGFGLGTEVTAFEFTNRLIQTVGATHASPLQNPSPNLWSWSGQGGWKQALLNDTLSFGLLKGAGYFSRESNIVFQHAFSSTAMVAGHQSAALLGIAPKQEGSLAEQLLHAEATNLQLGAGTSLVHTMAPGISALERGLDLSLRTNVGAGILPPWLDAKWRAGESPPLQWALAEGTDDVGFRDESPVESKKNPHILQMAAPDEPPSGGGKEGTPSTLPSGVKPGENPTFLSLASELGIEVSSFRAEQDLAPIRLKARSRVMTLLSKPEIASSLSEKSRDILRRFVVGGGDASEINRSLQELVEKLREKNRPPEPAPEPAQALVRVNPPGGARPALLDLPLQEQPLQVLMIKELPELLANPKIVIHFPEGRIQISLRGKRNLLLQDYFDFYQLIFRQAYEFRHLLQHLQNSGVDIQGLSPWVEAMDRLLREAADHLNQGHAERARSPLDRVDALIETFQREIFQLCLQMGWAPLRFAGRVPLYGQNDLPQPLEQRLLQEQQAPSPLAASAPQPGMKIPPVLESGPQEDYLVFIDRKDWILDFSRYPAYHLYLGEKNIHVVYDQGYRIEAGPLPHPNLYLGTFHRAPEGVVFEYSAGERTQKRRFDPHRPPSEDSQSSYRRDWNKVTLVPLAQPLTGSLAKTLAQKEGKLEDPLNQLLTQLLEVEEEVRKTEAHDIRVAQYQWTQIGRLFDPKSPFETAMEGARKQDMLKIANEVIFYLAHPWESLKNRAKEMLTALMPKMSHKDQQDLMPLLVASYFSRPDEASPFGKPHETLQKIIMPLSIDARKSALRLAAQQVARGPRIAQGDLDFLENLLGSFPTDVLEKMASPSDPLVLQLLIKAYRGGLPMVAPLYEQYLLSSEPDHYVAHAVERVNYFRQGGFLISKDPNYLAMAYGSLDNPEQLSFDQFAREVILEDLPKPFMNERFRVEVPLVKVAHAKVDKGIVKEAYGAVAKVHEKNLLVQYLSEALARPKQSGLSPFREKLPTEEVNSDNVIALSKKVLEALAEGRKNLSPQAREVVTNLAFGIAAQSENGQTLLPILALYHEKMSSDQLLQVLNALREFYGDAAGEVLKAYDFKLKPVEQMGERLKKQVDQMRIEAGAVQVIDLVPSKSQTDVFAGYVGEDCTKGRWKQAIHRPDTQVYRMLSNQRLAGMLYLKRQILDGDVVLVLGIEPRARFRVNAEALLDQVIRNLGEIAGRWDYDYILISTNSHERSNRPDMNDAIEKRFTGFPPKIYSEKVDGGIFSNDKFHVAWQRPARLPKGPAPSDSIGRVVSMEARTVLGNFLSDAASLPSTPRNAPPSRRRGR